MSDRTLQRPRGASERAPVMEVFASIQGEGRYVGEPQVFLRLWGCPFRCRWCDTPGSWSVPQAPRARIATDELRREEGWATAFQAACWIAEVEPGEPRTVSVTGGEPLLWAGFLAALRPMIAARRLHLETAGGHPQALARVLSICDHVSLDLKLPSDLDAPVPVEGVGGEPLAHDAGGWREARRRCLALVAGHDACAKVVVAGGREPRDYDPLLEDVARLAPRLPVVVQPVTPMAGVEAPDRGLITEIAERARELELDVRVLPQVHRLMRIP